MQNQVIMTIDIGIHNSGFCLFDLDKSIPVEHGCITSINTEDMCRDLFSIAKNRNIHGIIIELTGREDSATVKLRRLVRSFQKESGISATLCSAAEWRRPLRFTSKHPERGDFKKMALEYVREHFPEQYYMGMTDHEAEALCMSAAYAKGFCSFPSNKERRNEAARRRKNYYKHEEEDEYESTEYRKLYR